MRLAGGSLEKLNRITIQYYTLRVAAASFGLSLSIRTPQQDYGDASSKIVIILNCCAPVLAAAGQWTVYTCGRLPSIDVPLERMPVSTNVDWVSVIAATATVGSLNDDHHDGSDGDDAHPQLR